MPGMWELPEVESMNGLSRPVFTLRHSITVTDYTVRVWQNAVLSRTVGNGFRGSGWSAWR